MISLRPFSDSLLSRGGCCCLVSRCCEQFFFSNIITGQEWGGGGRDGQTRKCADQLFPLIEIEKQLNDITNCVSIPFFISPLVSSADKLKMTKCFSMLLLLLLLVSLR